MTIKRKVRYCLEHYPETRNSDIALTVRVWQEFYPSKVIDGKVSLSDLFDLPREDHIKRIRAKFNSEGRFYPTEYRIMKARKINEDKWREKLGYVKESETRASIMEATQRKML